jgi:heme/copper-type cytochrome/quinol oxidase subunit 2
MAAFIIGTMPLFLLIGVLAKGTILFQKKLAYVAAALVIGLGFYAINGALVYAGSPYTVQNIVASADHVLFGTSNTSTDKADANPTIEVLANGYSPDEITVPAAQPVTITLTAKGRLGCTSIFRIPQLNIEESVQPDGPTMISVQFPEPGTYTFTCGMGMYSGTIQAI